MTFKSLFLLTAILGSTYGCGTAQTNSVKGHTTEGEHYQFMGRGVRGTYASPPLLSNGKVDMHRLISELIDIHANTYNWLIWRKNSGDFAELKRFLPLAQKAGLKVWVTLVPPSEAPAPEPYGLDYDKWASKLAMLSKKEPCLVAWSIDDFTSNIILKHFTPEYVEGFLSKAHVINPKLQFVPCCYYKATISENFVKNYAPLLGGILFPYRAGSDGDNLTDPSLVASEVTKLRSKLGPEIPIIVDVYATTLYHHEDTTPEYIRKVVDAALKYADGVMIYTNQDPEKNTKKYNIIKKAFKMASH